MKILICGDSFCVTDSGYPNLHWSEKILNFSSEFTILNLAHGGCSNAMIVLQLFQGLQFNPDFVILSFTSTNRFEIDKNIQSIPKNLTVEELSNYQKDRYTTNHYNIDSHIKTVIDEFIVVANSENFERLKSYFNIVLSLTTLQQRNIPFCFSLGGFEYRQEYINFINSNYIENMLLPFSQNQLKTNLWYHRNNSSRPYFHVDNDDVQTLFANECISRIV